MNTTILNNGKTVLAKEDGSALIYTNRKQAEAKAAKFPGTSVWSASRMLRKVFLVTVS